jgi:hypothetical protein
MGIMNKDKIIYQLTIEDIQTVATEVYGRELSEQEIKKIIYPIGDRVAWYDIIDDCIRAYLSLEETEDEVESDV